MYSAPQIQIILFLSPN